MDLPNVAAWLGHADATVTLRHYMKASELEAPAALDALVASGKRIGSAAVLMGLPRNDSPPRPDGPFAERRGRACPGA